MMMMIMALMMIDEDDDDPHSASASLSRPSLVSTNFTLLCFQLQLSLLYMREKGKQIGTVKQIHYLCRLEVACPSSLLCRLVLLHR